MKDISNKSYTSPNAGALYFVGFIGALVYYVDVANGFWQVVVAFLKACVWPAFLTYDLLRFVH
jgi:hypothetical protein